ncbi:hypothetical protein RhiirA1_482217 [Rhizophagus irregularis]|uniref:Uncharacterized protein n=1 Tax=Rhizophagus irregularis TaxID=588596 RepID=A0A2N0QM54_9GLOM|nr:hypothetical protein RhiirA1_482217 [Rhizophagus irregularis]
MGTRKKVLASFLLYYIDYTFKIWQQFWVLAIICDFDKGLGFWQQFGISAIHMSNPKHILAPIDLWIRSESLA